jgi:hypothetical protein
MISYNFKLSSEELVHLLKMYPNLGKNSDVGKIAVEVAKLFLLSLNSQTLFISKRGIDLTASINGVVEDFEIKGTAANNISWNKLKVSSQFCYDNLVNGMSIIRVTNIGNLDMTIYYLKHDEDFLLIPEARWTIRRIKP